MSMTEIIEGVQVNCQGKQASLDSLGVYLGEPTQENLNRKKQIEVRSKVQEEMQGEVTEVRGGYSDNSNQQNEKEQVSILHVQHVLFHWFKESSYHAQRSKSRQARGHAYAKGPND